MDTIKMFEFYPKSKGNCGEILNSDGTIRIRKELWAILCHSKNRSRKTRSEAVTKAQMGNDGSVVQATARMMKSEQIQRCLVDTCDRTRCAAEGEGRAKGNAQDSRVDNWVDEGVFTDVSPGGTASWKEEGKKAG